MAILSVEQIPQQIQDKTLDPFAAMRILQTSLLALPSNCENFTAHQYFLGLMSQVTDYAKHGQGSQKMFFLRSIAKTPTFRLIGTQLKDQAHSLIYTYEYERVNKSRAVFVGIMPTIASIRELISEEKKRKPGKNIILRVHCCQEKGEQVLDDGSIISEYGAGDARVFSDVNPDYYFMPKDMSFDFKVDESTSVQVIFDRVGGGLRDGGMTKVLSGEKFSADESLEYVKNVGETFLTDTTNYPINCHVIDLYHCWGGAERSATLAVADLMYNKQISLTQAIELARTGRSVIKDFAHLKLDQKVLLATYYAKLINQGHYNLMSNFKITTQELANIMIYCSDSVLRHGVLNFVEQHLEKFKDSPSSAVKPLQVIANNKLNELLKDEEKLVDLAKSDSQIIANTLALIFMFAQDRSAITNLQKVFLSKIDDSQKITEITQKLINIWQRDTEQAKSTKSNAVSKTLSDVLSPGSGSSRRCYEIEFYEFIIRKQLEKIHDKIQELMTAIDLSVNLKPEKYRNPSFYRYYGPAVQDDSGHKSVLQRQIQTQELCQVQINPLEVEKAALDRNIKTIPFPAFYLDMEQLKKTVDKIPEKIRGLKKAKTGLDIEIQKLQKQITDGESKSPSP